MVVGMPYTFDVRTNIFKVKVDENKFSDDKFNEPLFNFKPVTSKEIETH